MHPGRCPVRGRPATVPDDSRAPRRDNALETGGWMSGVRFAAALVSALALSCGPAQAPIPPAPSPSADAATGALRLHASTGMVSGDECLTVFRDLVFFRGQSTDAGSELWRTDGTVDGTRPVLDLVPGPTGSRPGCGAVVGNRLFFAGDTPQNGREYYLSDGSTAGTFFLDLAPGAPSSVGGGSGADEKTLAGGLLFFLANDGVHGKELWATDGTRAGTYMVEDLWPGSVGSAPFQLQAVGSRVFFSADDGVHGRELWTSDGSASGTHLVADLFPGGVGSNPTLLGAAGDLLYFSACYRRLGDAEPACGIFRTEGSAGGTVRLLDGGAATRGVAFEGRFFFLRSGTPDAGLWASDGTPAGTAAVASMAVNWPPPATANGLVFFVGSDEAHGFELWASDGTPRGTRMVRDIEPGATPSFPYELTSLGNLVAFEARDARGSEPWLSDGTAAGTRMAAYVRPAASPKAFTLAGGRVFFVSANELWVLTTPPD